MTVRVFHQLTGVNSFFSFYPFVAVFSLYYHIVVVTDPEECEEDIRDLERLCDAVRRTAVDRQELTPVANALKVLNDVCRTLQDRKRTGSYDIPSSTQASASSDTLGRRISLLGTLEQEQGGSIPGITLAAANIIPQSGETFPFSGDFGIPLSQGISAGNPLEYMRELESGFVDRNWHDDWWNIDPVTDEGTGPGLVETQNENSEWF